MAEIPIEEKGGLGWLWLLLGALLLGVLAWVLLDNDGDDALEYNDDAAVAESTDTATNTGSTAATAAMAIGSNFDLENVRVAELTGDMSFIVDDAGTQRFVVFDETRTPNDATEGEYDINPGQMLNLSGRVMRSGGEMPRGVNATVPNGMDQYLFAESIEIVERP